MIQRKRFAVPVRKSGQSAVIEEGDTVDLVLQDGSVTRVYAAEVTMRGTRIGWHLDGLAVLPNATSSQNATADASDDTTGDALANALKTSYNALQADVAALFTAYPQLGSPTSAQNATAAASNDATRQALANALKANLNTAIADIHEVFTAHPELGEPTSEALATPDGSSDATTQTLLNDLKAAYNAAQVDIAEALSKLDRDTSVPYFIPRDFDVRAVNGNHQYNDPAIPEGELEDLVPTLD